MQVRLLAKVLKCTISHKTQHLVIVCYVNLKIKFLVKIICHYAQKQIKNFVKNIRTFFKVFLAFMQQLCYYSKARCENAA